MMMMILLTEKVQEYEHIVNLNNNDSIYTAINNNNRNCKSLNKWCKPRHGFYKINSDANLNCEGIWGLEDVVRDSDGSVLAAAAT
jgi:hypothetical protein